MKDFLHKHQDLLNSISFEMVTRKTTVSVAESCTGGFVSSCFTSNSGASQYFKGSMVVYDNASKIKLLQIPKSYIEKFGVASKHVVELMATQTRIKYDTDFGLATTGYVDISNNVFDLYAWISVSHKNNIVSECVSLKDKRLKNIELVSSSLLALFRKEIL